MSRLFVALMLFAAACGTNPAKPDPATTEGAGEAAVIGEDGEPIVEFAVGTEQVEIPSGPVTLKGTLLMPQGEAPHGGVVIVHDWGVRGRDGIVGESFGVRLPNEIAVYRSIADSLASRGFAVLIYDKRTCAQGSEPWCSYSADWAKLRPDVATAQLEDLRAAASWLGAREGVGKVALIGHGHGAELAVLAGGAAVALLQPPARPLPERAKFQLEESLRQIDARIAAVGDNAEADLLKVRKAEVEAALKAPNAAGLDAAAASDVSAVHAKYREALKATGTPRLAIVGAVDPGEDPADSTELMRMFGDDAVFVPQLSRLMVSLAEEDDPTMVSPAVVDRIARFLQDSLK